MLGGMFLFIFLIPAQGDAETRGSAEIFAELYEEYLPKVFRFIRYRIDDNSIAEDLTSVVFEKALTKIHTYRSQKAMFSTWIFTIARNTVTDHLRTSHRDQTVSLDPESGPGKVDTSPEEVVVKAEEYRTLHSGIARLSQPEQRIISLKFGAEMTNREIARMLGVSESNVGNTVFRAVRKLRDSFKGWRDE
jgi:RNA polymerase sigma-70 factor (ECF subfamily)